MKLIIDIPDQMYLNAKADTLCGSDILVKAVKNGIPHETVTEFADRCRECGKMRKGHWIWNFDKGYCKCSECGIGMGHKEFDYCPNCGCRMVEPQERSDKE